MTTLSPEEIMKLEKDIINIIGNEALSSRECEKKLFDSLGRQKFELVKTLLKNRFIIFYGSKLS
jgi:hypothetical protein